MNPALIAVVFAVMSNTQLIIVERAFYVMGSRMEVKLHCSNESRCQRAINDAHLEVRRLDHVFSNYRSDSVLAYVHDQAVDGRVSVPRDFIDLVEKSILYSKLTGGAFDITVGTIFELWKKSARRGVLPDSEMLRNAQRCVGFEKICVFPNKGKLELNPPCVRLDFGAIGKGYAVDRVVEILRTQGINTGIINFGGTVYAMDAPPGAEGWVVGVEDPGRRNKFLSKVRLPNMALSTSGDYKKYFEIDGKRYSHIIDPRTAKPASSVSLVTVISSSATEADALATGLVVIELDKSIELLESHTTVGAMIMGIEGDEYGVYKSSMYTQYEIRDK